MRSAFGEESDFGRKLNWSKKQAWSALSEITKLEMMAVGLSGYRYEEAMRLALRTVWRLRILEDLKAMLES
jgi:hypothetical protein